MLLKPVMQWKKKKNNHLSTISVPLSHQIYQPSQELSEEHYLTGKSNTGKLLYLYTQMTEKTQFRWFKTHTHIYVTGKLQAGYWAKQQSY